MTPEEQRIAIAMACGWTAIRECTCSKKCHRGFPPDGLDQHLPDYLNDLNAMHEAEKALEQKQIRLYAFTLAQVLDTSPTVDVDDQFINIHATAAERAEAFLKTLNLWKHQ